MSGVRQASLERTFSQSDFNRFARLSGDDNPIHTDPAFSTRSRFGRTVAHGLLLCSVLRGLIEQLAPGGRLAEQNVMFPAPTYANEPMLFIVTQTNEARGSQKPELELELTIKRAADDVVTCQGNCRVLI